MGDGSPYFIAQDYPGGGASYDESLGVGLGDLGVNALNPAPFDERGPLASPIRPPLEAALTGQFQQQEAPLQDEVYGPNMGQFQTMSESVKAKGKEEMTAGGIAALDIRKKPDGSMDVKNVQPELWQMLQESVQFRQQALAGYASELARIQEQERRRSPLVNVLTQVAGQLAQDPRVNPVVGALGRASMALNPTEQQLRAQRMAILDRQAEAADQGLTAHLRVEELNARRESVASSKASQEENTQVDNFRQQAAPIVRSAVQTGQWTPDAEEAIRTAAKAFPLIKQSMVESMIQAGKAEAVAKKADLDRAQRERIEAQNERLAETLANQKVMAGVMNGFITSRKEQEHAFAREETVTKALLQNATKIGDEASLNKDETGRVEELGKLRTNLTDLEGTLNKSSFWQGPVAGKVAEKLAITTEQQDLIRKNAQVYLAFLKSGGQRFSNTSDREGKILEMAATNPKLTVTQAKQVIASMRRTTEDAARIIGASNFAANLDGNALQLFPKELQPIAKQAWATARGSLTNEQQLAVAVKEGDRGKIVALLGGGAQPSVRGALPPETSSIPKGKVREINGVLYANDNGVIRIVERKGKE